MRAKLATAVALLLSLTGCWSSPSEPTAQAPSAYYENCDAVRKAGVAPLHKGDPGYRVELDRNRDGVACEE